MARWTKWVLGGSVALASLLVSTGGGCEIDADDFLEDLEEIEFRINEEVDVIQEVDPRSVSLPPALIDAGETVIIEQEVVIINNIQEDIIIEELPDVTIIGLENLTPDDAYYRYLVNGVLQGVFVFSGETLLLEYPCLDDIELLSEDYFDVFTGEFIEGFDLTDAIFFNPDDFFCGDAFIITFTLDDIFVEVTAIDLITP